jgi:nucleotide-binding universal stress UspA family protein
MDRTLIAVDLRADDGALVEEALVLLPATAIHVLHVAPPEPDFVGFGPGPPSVRRSLAAELRTEHAALERLVELARQRGHAAESHLIRAPTAEGILAEAERIGAARIVAKRRDRGLAAATILGSTTRTLLRQATCPVLVLPP